MMMRAFLLLLAALPLAAQVEAKPRATAPVRAADWSKVVSATPAGGFVMGNFAAKVKLVEYGSLTCSHCRRFDAEGVPPLIADYVRTGKVNWEFRPYLLNGYDIPATQTARCGGAKGFFPAMRALYAGQPQWVARMQAIPDDRLTAIQAMPPERQSLAIGQAAGFTTFASAQGVAPPRLAICLGNRAEIDRLVEVTRVASTKYNVHGTPAFLINGANIDYSAGPTVWAVIEARLKAALSN